MKVLFANFTWKRVEHLLVQAGRFIGFPEIQTQKTISILPSWRLVTSVVNVSYATEAGQCWPSTMINTMFFSAVAGEAPLGKYRTGKEYQDTAISDISFYIFRKFQRHPDMLLIRVIDTQRQADILYLPPNFLPTTAPTRLWIDWLHLDYSIGFRAPVSIALCKIAFKLAFEIKYAKTSTNVKEIVFLRGTRNRVNDEHNAHWIHFSESIFELIYRQEDSSTRCLIIRPEPMANWLGETPLSESKIPWNLAPVEW